MNGAAIAQCTDPRGYVRIVDGAVHDIGSMEVPAPLPNGGQAARWDRHNGDMA